MRKREYAGVVLAVFIGSIVGGVLVMRDVIAHYLAGDDDLVDLDATVHG